jgi:hypothetical protein
VVLLLISVVLVRNINKTRSLTVHFENADSVSVFDSAGEVSGGKDKLLATIKKSGDTVRIDKTAHALVTYRGSVGYTNGFVRAPGAAIEIHPEYSAERIAEIIHKEGADIHEAVFDGIKNTNLYTLNPGTLYDHGSWYISVLVPQNDPENRLDTLRVLVKKSSGKWKMASPPRLVFTTYNTEGVPIPVLNAANSYLL